ncbi:MAG: hypothetical protein KF851_00230 [Pirellulaceae bacterium]|nr:hypothetical protein [Pirellulaceae bacterium]
MSRFSQFSQCQNKVAQTIYANDSGIPILKCPSCSSVWLVPGQLASVVLHRNGHLITDELAQAITISLAQSNRLNNVAELI